MDVTGASDPYCKLEYGSQRYSTAVKKETLAPVWNEEFVFHVHPATRHPVNITMWDEDRFGSDDFMGLVVLDAGSIEYDATQDEWIPLSARPGKRDTGVRGELRLRYRLVSHSAQADSLCLTKLFGVPLFMLMSHLALPKAFAQWIEHVESRGVEEEGIFRVAGSATKLEELRLIYDRGELPVLSDLGHDTANIAQLIKKFLRDLPEPLMTFDMYPEWMAADQELPHYLALYDRLPLNSRVMLYALLRLLRTIERSSSINKMNGTNLGIVFGPSLLRKRNETLEDTIESSPQKAVVITLLIENFESIRPPSTYSAPPPLPVQLSALVKQPPAPAEAPPARAEEPTAPAEDPPAAVEEPPAPVEEPPAPAEDPPAAVEEPPADRQEAPDAPGEAPLSDSAAEPSSEIQPVTPQPAEQAEAAPASAEDTPGEA
eukprot:TRINITY_DN7555_c0_g1_i2.p1 TRINITY_DN7555_c0_g1~~TRINITY_DN7555_c0_g1_i2.p1  ORF type:complete len:478 (+),score=101.27 TRINITY_DN7555_c0_g1_i2:142-1434(+)